MGTPLWHPSPNFGPRREGALPDMIVLHYTAMPTAQGALDRLCDPGAEVSAHYLIGSDGQLWQMVKEENRAWHAGAGAWGIVTDVNSRSIGIELDNLGTHPFSAPQMNTLEALLSAVMERWAIPPERVIGHSDMAPERKHDPGPRFDWRRLARQGLSVWPDPVEPSADCDFHGAAMAFGYPAHCTADERLAAFRDRFRPGATGPEDATDRALMATLATNWPVNP